MLVQITMQQQVIVPWSGRSSHKIFALIGGNATVKFTITAMEKNIINKIMCGLQSSACVSGTVHGF